jgi:hypothetical protein
MGNECTGRNHRLFLKELFNLLLEHGKMSNKDTPDDVIGNNILTPIGKGLKPLKLLVGIEFHVLLVSLRSPERKGRGYSPDL